MPTATSRQLPPPAEASGSPLGGFQGLLLSVSGREGEKKNAAPAEDEEENAGTARPWSSLSPRSDSASSARSNAARRPRACSRRSSGTPSSASGGSSGQEPPTPATAKVKKKRIRIKTERRREQCRINQARYRDKQRAFGVELAVAVEHLSTEIERLEAQQRALRQSVHTQAAAPQVVAEFFQLFRHGLNVHGESPHHLPRLEAQVAFITSAFEEELQMDEFGGRTCFLEQTRRFSTLFDALAVEMCGLTSHSEPTVCRVESRLHATVSPDTIRFVFPLLLRDEHAWIRRKLLGHRLACAASWEFVFGERGQVSHVHWRIDFVAALQAVLTIEEAGTVLLDARIVRDAFLLSTGEGPGGDHDRRQRGVAFRDARQTARSLGRVVGEPRPAMLVPATQAAEEAKSVETEGCFLVHDGLGDDFVMV